MPTVEILYFEGCPSVGALLPRLRAIVADHGCNPDAIRLRLVETAEAAVGERFLGSPTVRVDGRDVDPTAIGRDDYGIQCRIYRSDEAQSPIPFEDWIHAALDAGTSERFERDPDDVEPPPQTVERERS